MGWKHTQTPIKDKPLLPTLMIVNTQTKELPGKSHPNLALNQGGVIRIGFSKL